MATFAAEKHNKSKPFKSNNEWEMEMTRKMLKFIWWWWRCIVVSTRRWTCFYLRFNYPFLSIFFLFRSFFSFDFWILNASLQKSKQKQMKFSLWWRVFCSILLKHSIMNSVENTIFFLDQQLITVWIQFAEKCK